MLRERQEEHTGSSDVQQRQMDWRLWIVKVAVIEWCFSKGSWEPLLLVPSAYAITAARGDHVSHVSPEPVIRSWVLMLATCTLSRITCSPSD